jgi:inorganic triphosphatase YgiF
MDAVLEVEIKLRATDAALADLAVRRRLGPATLGAPRAVDEHDAYLDTADRRLAASRWACRLRTRDGRRWISLKGPAIGTPDAVHRRPEVEGEAPLGPPDDPATWPASPARDLVLRLARGAPLEERLALRQRRTERTVMVDGSRAGTLSLDVARVLIEGAELGALRVVELELAAGSDPGLVKVLGAALAGVQGLEPEPASKLERALALAEGAGRAVR